MGYKAAEQKDGRAADLKSADAHGHMVHAYHEVRPVAHPQHVDEEGNAVDGVGHCEAEEK